VTSKNVKNVEGTGKSGEFNLDPSIVEIKNDAESADDFRYENQPNLSADVGTLNFNMSATIHNSKILYTNVTSKSCSFICHIRCISVI
jgi:hypothetical protein